MKKNYGLFIFFIVSIFLCNKVNSQNLQYSPSTAGQFTICPGDQVSYSVSHTATVCTYYWEITGGTFSFGGGTTAFGSNLAITWGTSDMGTIKITAQSCTNSNYNGNVLNLQIPIKAVYGQTPLTPVGQSSVTVNTSPTLRYEVDLITYRTRGSSDANPFYVTSYQWEVPSGWTITNQNYSVSNVKAYIDVRPDNCTGGTIRVRGKSSCGEYYSNWSPVKAVARTLATPGAVSGPDAVDCTDTSVKSYSISAVTGATSYTWTLPSGWSGSSTTTSINATPNGLNGGAVTVKANGCSIQSSASSKTITVNLTNPSSPPSVSGSSPVCYSGTTFTLSNLPAYASVSWTQSSNLTQVSGQGTTSYTVRANSTTTSGSGWVDAVISTPCGTAPAVRYNVWVGKPYDFLVSGPTVVPASSYNNYSAVEWNNQPSFTGQGVGSGGFSWSFGYPPTSAGWNCFGCTGQTVLIQAGSQSTYVTGQVANTCGSTQRNYEVFVECPTGDCEEPFFVYPNPSSDELTVSSSSKDSSASEITLTDSNGTVVYSARTKGDGQIKIPVRGYKNGTYYLSITENGTTKQRQIIINH